MCKKDYSDLGASLEETNVMYSEGLSMVEPANRVALDRRSQLPAEGSLEVSALEA
jgi:hypothetical protein